MSKEKLVITLCMLLICCGMGFMVFYEVYSSTIKECFVEEYNLKAIGSDIQSETNFIFRTNVYKTELLMEDGTLITIRDITPKLKIGSKIELKKCVTYSGDEEYRFN